MGQIQYLIINSAKILYTYTHYSQLILLLHQPLARRPCYQPTLLQCPSKDISIDTIRGGVVVLTIAVGWGADVCKQSGNFANCVSTTTLARNLMIATA